MNGKFALILIISLMIGFGFGYAISTQAISELQSEVSSLQTDYQRLLNEKQQLQTWLKENNTRYESLENSLESQIASLQNQINSLKEQLSSLNLTYQDYVATHSHSKFEYETLFSQYQNLNATYHELLEDYQQLLNTISESTLKNPTWDELKLFLKQDKTDELTYDPENFDCTGFAITLRDNAWKYGFRCTYVEIEFTHGPGHALNAFQTTDKGLIFIDVVEEDCVAYVQAGQPYGIITLNSVKATYIDCSGDPNRFWGPLNYTSHPSPFSYNYYIEYQKRVEFYYASVDAYKKAVEKYNKGEGGYTYSQLQSWLENLKALKEELSTIYVSMGTVQNIEIYWN